MPGFASSSLARTGCGACLCILAAGMVWLVERPRATALPAPVPSAVAPTSARTVPLQIESTYPVATWQVAADGVIAHPEHSSPWVWNGAIHGSPGGEILIVGTAAAGDASLNRCLRTRLGNAAPAIHWGGGDVTVLVAIP
jgi:hypothetical protein